MRVPRKVHFMVSLTSYRIQLSLPPSRYKTKLNFQKMTLFVFLKCIVLGAWHVLWAWLSWFCTYCDWKNEDFNYISSLTRQNTSHQMIWRLVLHKLTVMCYHILFKHVTKNLFPPIIDCPSPIISKYLDLGAQVLLIYLDPPWKMCCSWQTGGVWGGKAPPPQFRPWDC